MSDINVIIEPQEYKVTVSNIPICNSNSINTGILTGLFYPLNANPAGYVTSTLGGTSVSVNNSSFFTGIFLTGISGISLIISGNTVFVSGQNSSSIDTGILTGIFYPLNNPSGFITGIDLSNYVTISQTGNLTGQFAQLNENNIFTGSNTFNNGLTVLGTLNPQSIYVNNSSYLDNGRISTDGAGDLSVMGNITMGGNLVLTGFNSGIYTLNSNTGNFITIFQTGNFYTNNNPSGFITGVNLSNYVTLTQTGLLTGQFYPLNSNPDGYITSNQTGIFALSSNLNSTGSYLLGLINASSAGVSSLNSASGAITLAGAGNVSIITVGQTITVSGNTGILTGSFVLNSNTGSFITNSQTGAFASTINLQNTGTTLQTEINILNNLSGSFVLTGNTGIFALNSNLQSTGSTLQTLINSLNTWTGISTGLYYPYKTNPSGYITGLNTGNFVTNIQTGLLTGQFYPLNSNPLSYIIPSQTGIFVTTGNTGNFVTNMQSGLLTGVFYPLILNPNNYIMSSQTGNFITTGQTGNFGGNTNNYYINSGLSGSYIFSTLATSGVNNQFISYPTNLGNNPYVLCSLSNTIGGTNILVQPSGITSSGFWAQYGNLINNTGYILTTIASISTNTGLATTVVINNYGTNNISIKVSGNFNISTSSGNIYLVDSTLHVITGTLPDATTLLNSTFTIKDWLGNCMNNNIILTGIGGQTIDGVTNQILNINYMSLNCFSNGINWSLL